MKTYPNRVVAGTHKNLFKNIYTFIVGIFASVLLSSCIGSGQNYDFSASGKENYFPTLEGIDLKGETKEMPKAFAGDLNIVAVAFERVHQDDVNTWIPVADNIIESSEGVNFYELPVIYKISKAARFWVNNGMRAGVREEKSRARTITVYTDREDFLASMDMDGDYIYLLLLDNKGKILMRQKGEATPEGIEKLENAIQENLAGK